VIAIIEVMQRTLSPLSIGILLSTLAFAGPTISLEPVFSGLNEPLFLTHAGDGSGRIFLVERPGRILIAKEGQILSTPFLDISSKISTVGEMGLLGVAFHPEFAVNGRFYVNYATSLNGPDRTVVSEFNVSAVHPDLASPTERILFELTQPARNHNAGMLAFGPDGLLYIATGDGGGGGDPFQNGQNPATLHAKILRIDVDSGDPYAIPSTNPFIGVGEFREETYAWGFRNPWRFSFDRAGGRLFAADVGQVTREEVNIVRPGGNYGWSIMEGSICFPPGTECDPSGLELPITEYGRDEGQSITGGYVYRGSQLTPLFGSYIFGDFRSGTIWSLTERAGGVWVRRTLLRTSLSIASFGEDEEGELYVLDLAGGDVFRIQFGWEELFAFAGDGPDDAVRFRSRLILANDTAQTISGSIEFFDVEGAPAQVSVDGSTAPAFPFDLPPRSARSFLTGGSSEPLYVGWVRAIGDGVFSGSVLFTLEDQAGATIREAGIASSTPSETFTAFVSRNAGDASSVGIAMVNPSSDADATVQIEIESLTDEWSEQVQVVLGPGRMVSLFLEEIAGVAESFEGSFRINSDLPLAATLIRTRNGMLSASLPASGAP
jgi:glucose/arabinose dehydrogenase